jgi:hypothetical protein
MPSTAANYCSVRLAWEPVVPKTETKSGNWVKPRVVRLGKLKNVAGPNNTGGQGGKS